MERLTKPCENTENGKYISYVAGNFTGIYPDCILGKVVERLAYYEDLEEQGRLIILDIKDIHPCNNMINVTNDRTLCCSNTCEKRFECGKSAIHSVGMHYVEDYSRFGSGTCTDNGCEIEYWCGKNGNYKMFEPIKNTMVLD